MQEYIMPANSKKSRLILGMFTQKDLVVLAIGLPISAVMLIAFRALGFWMLVVGALPGLTAVLLVMPVPHYHNVLQLITNIFKFYTGRRKYEWKGWTVTNEE